MRKTLGSRNLMLGLFAAAVMLSALPIGLPAASAGQTTGVVGLLPPGFGGDTTADAVLGQVSFLLNGANFVDGRGLRTSPVAFGTIALDKTVVPNRVYVADSSNNRVLGWSTVTAFTTHLPADLVIGQPDLFSNACNNGGVTASSLCLPVGLAVDSAARLYVADQSNHRVLEYDSPFTTDRVADDVFGQSGSFMSGGCDAFGVSAASLCNPTGLAVDGADNLYVADFSNQRVLEYHTPEAITATPGSGDTTADTVFGQFGSFIASGCNLTGVSANSLCQPIGVALDGSNNLYVAEFGNNRVLEYNTPLSTDTTADRVFGQYNFFTLSTCNTGGVNQKTLCQPTGVAVDGSGNLYVADRSNNRALEYDTPLVSGTTADRVFGQNNVFTSNTCNNTFGGTSTPVSTKSLCFPANLITDGAGNLFLVDSLNNRILEYNTPIVSGTAADAVVGQVLFTTNFADQLDGRGFDLGTAASGAVAIDRHVIPNRVYVVDPENSRVLGWSSIAAFSTHAAADLVLGQPNFFVRDCNDGGITATSLCIPRGAAVDSAGNLYVSDTSNNRVLEYDNPFVNNTTADRVFGQAGFTTNSCDSGGVSQSVLCSPGGVALDGSNNLYVADFSNNRVLEYNTPLTTDTTADLVFGQGGVFTTNTCNNGGVSANSLCNPFAVAVGGANLFVADFGNSRVLEYNTPLTTDTTADLVFGQGGVFTTNTCNNGGVSADSLCLPKGVAVAGANLFVSDTSNSRVLKYNSPLTTNTTADKVFGQGSQFNQNGCKPLSPNSLCIPDGIAVDSANNLYVADTIFNRVLKYLTP